MPAENKPTWDSLFNAADEYGFEAVDITFEQQGPGAMCTMVNLPVATLREMNLNGLILVSWQSRPPLRVTPKQGKHSHYFKDVRHLDHIDVYRVLELFGVSDPCISHAVKKLLVSGNRGGGKDRDRDIQEAIDSLERYKEMRREENEINRN